MLGVSHNLQVDRHIEVVLYSHLELLDSLVVVDLGILKVDQDNLLMVLLDILLMERLDSLLVVLLGNHLVSQEILLVSLEILLAVRIQANLGILQVVVDRILVDQGNLMVVHRNILIVEHLDSLMVRLLGIQVMQLDTLTVVNQGSLVVFVVLDSLLERRIILMVDSLMVVVVLDSLLEHQIILMVDSLVEVVEQLKTASTLLVTVNVITFFTSPYFIFTIQAFVEQQDQPKHEDYKQHLEYIEF